jgi:uncharacterized SAM-binding protein YcdF (DUF218 family)
MNVTSPARRIRTARGMGAHRGTSAARRGPDGVRDGGLRQGLEMPYGSAVKDYVIVFGAAVRPDGRPSASLRRRIEGALAWSRSHADALFIPTGGVGRAGPAEAAVIRDCLIEGGIAADRIIPEMHGRDTLESVRLCDAILRKRGDCGRILCCTSTYHQPRCALLFRLLGYEVVRPPMPAERRCLPAATYARLVLKEWAATPYDALLLLARPRLAGPPGR